MVQAQGCWEVLGLWPACLGQSSHLRVVFLMPHVCAGRRDSAVQGVDGQQESLDRVGLWASRVEGEVPRAGRHHRGPSPPCPGTHKGQLGRAGSHKEAGRCMGSRSSCIWRRMGRRSPQAMLRSPSMIRTPSSCGKLWLAAPPGSPSPSLTQTHTCDVPRGREGVLSQVSHRNWQLLRGTSTLWAGSASRGSSAWPLPTLRQADSELP